MWAHLDCRPHILARVFEDGQQYGDPYRFTMSLRLDDSDTVSVVGITERNVPTSEEARAIHRALKDNGFTVMRQRNTGCNPGEKELK